MTVWQAIVLAIVESITEFLPVSSTGHMILTSWAMGIHQQSFVKDFTVIVQFAAILAVLVLYWKRFLKSYQIYLNLLISFLPAAILGLLLKDKIDIILGNVTVVAWALVLGGIVLVYIEKYLPDRKHNYREIDEIPKMDCLKIGIYQCFAFIPGVSRSAASILGGLFLGLNRQQAAEYSFLLAVPTLFAASSLKLYKSWATLTSENLNLLILGGVVAFFGSVIVIKGFVHFLNKYGFAGFGYYRIALGIIMILVLNYSDRDLTLL